MHPIDRKINTSEAIAKHHIRRIIAKHHTSEAIAKHHTSEDTKWRGTHKEEARTDKKPTAKENTNSKTQWVGPEQEEEARTDELNSKKCKFKNTTGKKDGSIPQPLHWSQQTKKQEKEEKKKEEIRMEVQSSSSTLYLGMRWTRLAPKWLKATVTSMFLSKVS